MRGFVRPLLVLAVVGVLAGCDSAEEQAENYYQSALELMAAGDYDRAAVEFRNVFQLVENHREARTAFADMLLEQGDRQEAFRQYQRLAEQYPDDLRSREVLAQTALDSQQWPEVRRFGGELIQLAPDSDLARATAVALKYVDATEAQDSPAIDAAAAEAESLSAELPDQTVLRFILMQQAVNNQDSEGALRELDEVLARIDDRPALYKLRLQLLSGMNRSAEVESQLLELIERFPEDPEFVPALLRFYETQGRPDDSVTFLQGYVANRPDDTQALNTLIEFLTLRQGPEAAIAQINSLIGTDSNQILLRTQRARLQFDTGNRAEAISDIENLIAETESSDDLNAARIVLARMLLVDGNEVGARRQVEEVLAIDSSNTAAIKMQAAWMIQDDDPDAAVNLLRIAIDENPEDWQAMLLTADALTRAGNHELSRDYVSLAVEASNSRPEVVARFVDLMVSEDRLLIAEEALVKALRINPDNVPMLAKLGQVQVARQDWPRVQQVEQTLRRIGGEEPVRVATGLEVARLAGQSQVAEAMQTLESLTETDDSVQTVAAVVRARLSSGDVEGAMKLALESLEKNPDDLSLQLIVASIKLGSGDSAGAKTDLESILARNDQVETAWMSLIRIASAAGDVAERDSLIERSLAAIPNSISLAWAKASVATEEGRLEEAIEIYESVYDRASASPVIANNLATLLATTRDDPESLERAYVVARRLRGTDVPAFQDTYGWIAFRRGEVQEALGYLESAAAALPGEPSVQYHLGRVYLELGRKEDALRYFLNAAETDTPDVAQFPQIGLARQEADTLIAEGISPTPVAE